MYKNFSSVHGISIINVKVQIEYLKLLPKNTVHLIKQTKTSFHKTKKR